MAEDTKPEIDILEKDERDTADFWRRWIKSAEKAAKTHWLDARDAWAEYEKKPFASDAKRESERSYPIYWSSCKVLEPAYYSRTPKITTRRRFDIRDEVSVTASLIAERLGQYLIDQSEFDATMQAAVQDFIHADKTTVQVLYHQEAKESEARIALMPQGADFVTEDGSPYTEEVFSDAEGYFGKGVSSEPTNQKITLSSLPFDEILHTPDAKSEAEIREKAYYFYMCRDEAEARFPDKKISWKNKKTGAKADKNEDASDRDRGESIGEYVEGWEIWSKPNRKVYWISSQYGDGFLDEKPDPYGLSGFFPSPPFIIGSKPSKSLYPTPAFVQLSALIDELHTASSRVSRLIKGIRRRALVSGDEVLCSLLESTGEAEFIAAEQLLQKVLEKGGVDSLIWYIPVQELVTAITELTSLQEKFKNEFYEWFGVPDVLRGATEPMESATAQQLKAESAHDRFKWQKKLVQQLARDAIEAMVDLALGVYPDEKIARCVGFDFMDPEDQQRFPAALAMLRNDEARMIRIEIESDSMSFVDEQLRAQQVNAAVTTMTAGLKEVSQMMEISPQAAAVGLQALLLSLDTMPAGKDFHDEVKQTVQALIEQAKNPPEPAPPPPDYEMLKIQVEQQKAQNAAMKDQMAAQAQMRELDRKDYELQLKAGTEQANVQLAQYKASLERYVQEVMVQLESQRVQIEQFKAQMQARESEMEEIRLAREVDAKAYQAAVDSARSTEPAEATPPVINIINAQAPKAPEPTILPIVPTL